MSFSGYPQYLTEASESLGLTDVDDARRQPALGHVANLIAQALDAPPSPGRLDTIHRAKQLRDGLKIAAKAAELMVDLVEPKPSFTAPPKGSKSTV